MDKVQTWRYGVDARQHGFFLVKRVRHTPTGATDESPPADFTWEVASLGRYESGFFNGAKPEDQFIAFVDPSTYPTNPGWMLRNFLVLIRQRWKLDHVQILCYRETQSRRDEPRSLILQLRAGEASNDEQSTTPQMPKVTGWERNRDGKLASKVANLADYLDPTR